MKDTKYYRWQNAVTPAVGFLLAVMFVLSSGNALARDYEFDGPMSRETLESYLSRANTSFRLLIGSGDIDDDVRMLKETGVKFAGRAIHLWGDEPQLPERLRLARKNALKVHQADPEIILQACVFEIVGRGVEQIAVPERVFEEFGLPVQKRNFLYEAMISPDGHGKNHWRRSSSIPDISQIETQLWFYHLATAYIDVGIEAIHFGQAEIMDHNDPDGAHWASLLGRVRKYASQHARRHWVVCDAHVPSGGMHHDGRLLFDFHSFPLRIAEVAGQPQKGELRIGYTDSFYGRSKGGVTPSGWQCEALPYLVELDNFGVSRRPGEPGQSGFWIWGYDEISWFAHQPKEYRNTWLHYAWHWVREHDANGYLQMPGSRCLHAPVDGKVWYYANRPSKATPDGFGQEDAIRAIWAAD